MEKQEPLTRSWLPAPDGREKGDESGTPPPLPRPLILLPLLSLSHPGGRDGGGYTPGGEGGPQPWRRNDGGEGGRGRFGGGEGRGRFSGPGRGGPGRGPYSGPPGGPSSSGGTTNNSGPTVRTFGPNAPRGGGRGGRFGGRGGGRGDKAGGDRAAADRRRRVDDSRATGTAAIAGRRSSRAARKQAREDKKEEFTAQDVLEVGPSGMPVEEVARRLATNPGAVVRSLFLKGIMATVNQVLDADTVRVVAADLADATVVELDGAEVEARERARQAALLAAAIAGDDDEEDSDDDDGDDGDDDDGTPSSSAAKKQLKRNPNYAPRPPVVTVMGHVDHGKTSLLDCVRNTRVAAGEAGGITQAIGAYTCDVATADGPRAVTFLDTPGHEAFSAMRARGARVTDIAVIVVAADDGVRPQTLEAISHARAAGVPIIVAINKVDKEGADPDRARSELAEAGLVCEEWGGDTPMIPISAKRGDGVDDLLETLALIAEVEELGADPTRPAAGTVIEAHLDRRAGPAASVLVATGTLRPGDIVVAGACFGRVRALSGAAGVEVAEAGPSIAVKMVGLNAVPAAGDTFEVCATEQEARRRAEATEAAARLGRLSAQAGSSKVTTMSIASLDDDGDGGPGGGAEGGEALQRLNVILKADAAGAVEAVQAAAGALPQDRVALRWLLAAANEVTTSDVDLAFASDALIIGFNVAPSDAVSAAAKRAGVEIKSFAVIYDLVDDLRARMEGRLSAVSERRPMGAASCRAVFGSGSRRVAGCVVTEGSLKKGCHLTVTRKGKLVAEGPLTSLRRVKEDVKEVDEGTECGVGLAGFSEWEAGDAVAAFEILTKQRTLEEASSEVAGLAAALTAPSPEAAGV